MEDLRTAEPGTGPSAASTPPAANAAPTASTLSGLSEGTTRRHEILTGIRLSLAAGLGMFPIGVAFGLLVMQTGLPWWVAPGLSIGLFAGRSEGRRGGTAC